ncbi:hypothetical protein ON010_g5503 [Phytophthora cinnamomi]|nr:hypothetical protein ON010_g5503 [Phytophthora cinnamomi]
MSPFLLKPRDQLRPFSYFPSPMEVSKHAAKAGAHFDELIDAVTAAAASSKASTSPASFNVKAHDDRARMLLKNGYAGREHEEERTLDNSLLSKLKNGFAALTRRTALSPDELQVRAWIKKKETPDGVFKFLKLDEGIDSLLENPKLQLWTAYLTKYNEKHRGEEVNTLGMFTKTYGDETVATMLEKAKQNPSTAEVATALQNEQLVAWMVNGLSTDFVFTWFKLDEGGMESLLANPALGVWCNYFSNLNQYNPGREVSMINKVLDTHEDIPFAKAIVAAMKNEDTQLIASKLQKAQFEKWLVDEKTPDTISKMLMDTKAGWMYMSIVREYDEFYKSANKMDELMTEAFNAACDQGASVRALEYLLGRAAPDWNEAIGSAARGGHLHVLHWMVTKRQDRRGPWRVDFSGGSSSGSGVVGMLENAIS